MIYSYCSISDNVYFIPNCALAPTQVRVILDCGANVGITSLYLASRYPNAQIFSIEPDSDNFSLLLHNTRCEPRITPIRAAVVGKPRESVRVTRDAQGWRNKVTENEQGESVHAITIEQICEQYKLLQIDLLKVDIEGAEREVFHNGSFLGRVLFVIAELHDSYLESDFEIDMAAHGLVTAAIGTLPGVRMTTASRTKAARATVI